MDRTCNSPGAETFYRGTHRILGGVCSGLAEGFQVEALWVRVAFVVLAFINGVGLLLYVLGAILVVLGIAFLAANSGITWNVILPAALIALGSLLLVRNLENRS